MRLKKFQNVHPDWEVVRSLEHDEMMATLDLLITAMLLDGRITDAERETLVDELARLPSATDALSGPQLRQMVLDCEAEMRGMDSTDFGEHLDRTCSRIEGDAKRQAVLRLVAILAVADGFSEEEFDLCRAIGERFDMSDDRVEEILRATWEERQTQLGDPERATRPVSAPTEPRRETTAEYPFTTRWTESTGDYGR